ncbi:MAG: ABC transporter ATP-binding protein [Clostridia bacterium]|nr:ABC transporter ATP-binding protein [Clostridia bacterium]
MNLKINDIHKFYGEKESRTEVLKGITCEVKDGEICVLLGPSGSGKSTLLNIIGGLESADSGSISIGNTDTDSMTDKELSQYRRDTLGFVFQFYNLIPDLTIKENIEVCAYLSPSPLDINELLDTLGLTDHQDKFPNQLSGGQQQRCAIGRALVKNPKLLLCDEPTGALDYKTSKEILELIEKINKRYKNTIVIVTHNQAIGSMADRILKLRDGKIVKDITNETKISAKALEW